MGAMERRILTARAQRKGEATNDDVKDALTEAFKAMRKDGILARQNFSCCGGCASYELGTKLEEAKAAGKPKVGTVYYHRQDAEGLRRDGTVYLGFGAGRGSSDDDSRLVACKALEALNDAGLKTEWDGTPRTRIWVDGLKEGN